jgi:hypothetical protein
VFPSGYRRRKWREKIGAEFDPVYSLWTILYIPEPLDMLAKLPSYNEKAILFISMPFTKTAAFICMQTS